MPALQNRSRIVTFRLSEEEYERLQVVSVARGVRSISEFVRMAVCWILSNCHRHVWDLLSNAAPATNLRTRESIALEAAYTERVDPPARGSPRLDSVVLSELKALNNNLARLYRVVEEAKRTRTDPPAGVAR